MDADETDDRHRLVYDTYESGRMSLDEYLDYLVFYEERNFSRDNFKDYMYSCSRPYPDMIELLKSLKEKYHLKIIAISNEGREINQHRIKTFQLNSFIDCFVSSCFVKMRKPDKEMFRMAIDMAQTPTDQCVYIDDRPILVEVAKTLGLSGIVHKGYEDTKSKLEQLLA